MEEGGGCVGEEAERGLRVRWWKIEAEQARRREGEAV